MTNNLYEFHKTYQENLINLFKLQRISRTIAVFGPNGIGKKDFLIDLVKSRFKKPDKIDKDIHPDCLIIDSTDGKILVEDLIELNSWAIQAPFEEVEKILLINSNKFFCFFVSIRTNIVQKMFYKSSFVLTILKKVSKIGLKLTTKLKKLNFHPIFSKVIHQLKKY